MRFEKHYELKGKHALFSMSKNSWMRKDSSDIYDYIDSEIAKKLGTELHEYAEMAITHYRKQPKNNDTVNRFINDAIGYRMKTEQPLVYSRYVFGTADAISFEKDILRIHDLKTGRTPAHMEQLEGYAALFCLEYHKNPKDIQIELRIYQNNEVVIENPEPEVIQAIMEKIVEVDEQAHERFSEE